MSPTTGDVPTPEPVEPAHPEGSISREGQLPLDWGANLGGTLTAWIHPLQSSAADGMSLLTVVIDRPADGGKISSGFMTSFKGRSNSPLPEGFTLIDPTSVTAARALVIDGKTAATSDAPEIAPGGKVTITVAFPPVSAGSVFVTVPGFDLVEVPVRQEGAGLLPPSATAWAVSTSKVGGFAPVESWAMSLVTKSTVEVAGDQVLVELPADVLFAFDKSELSAKAKKVVDKAGRKIAEAAAESGEITIVGHTDDQGDDASNDRLSKARAESVAARLRPILGSSFRVKTVGKGSREPKVKGTSKEARAANRRVEITFTGRSANKLVVVDDVPTELPETKGTVVSGMETARTKADLLNPELDVRVVSLKRLGGQLVGVIEVAAVTERAGSAMLFGDSLRTVGIRSERGFGFGSIANVSLLTPTTRVFPSDFTFESNGGTERRLLGSQAAEMLPVPGGARRYVVVWPDADPSATTVTVDAPDGYRFRDVPIS